MSSSPYRLPAALPRLRRAEGDGALGGVAAGIANALAVDPTLIRLTLALLVLADGAGVAAYAGAWLALPAEEGPAPSRRRRLAGYALLALAGVLVLRGLGLSDELIWPLALGAAALGLIRSHRGRHVAAGVVLGLVALIAFVDWNAGDAGGGPGLDSSAVAVALLLVLGPWAWRLALERDAERTARIRQEERADLAARVHDSVLQTLALVQREAADPRRVATLARRQERELRAWLYPDPAAAPSGLGAALDAAATEVEELHEVRVEVVRTGDVPLDERVEALALAAREAMANAAKHSGADEVSAFVDVAADEIAVYVRDRGAGFDPDAVPSGSHGISESIRARMARAGGSAAISSGPDGTEVELRLVRRA